MYYYDIRMRDGMPSSIGGDVEKAVEKLRLRWGWTLKKAGGK